MAGTNEKLQIKKIGFGEAIKSYFSNLFNFNGRATRSEFWWSFLFNAIICGVFMIAWMILLTVYHDNAAPKAFMLLFVLPLAAYIFAFAISFRRMHDIGKSGIFVIVKYGILIISVVFTFLTLSLPSDILADASNPLPDTFSTVMGVSLFIYVIIAIIFMIFALKPSSPTNKYGEPKIEQ